MVNGTFNRLSKRARTTGKSLSSMSVSTLRRLSRDMRIGLDMRSRARAEIKRRGLRTLPQVASQRGRKIARRFAKRTSENRIIG